MKSQKWTFVKTALITYLAVSKILYWIDAASEMMQGDIGGARIAIILRILGRDLPLILAVIGFVFIHKSKGRLWVKLLLGYVATITILFLYLFIMVSIGRMTVMSYFNLFVYYSVSYAIINVVLLVKDFVKKRAKGDEVSIINSDG